MKGAPDAFRFVERKQRGGRKMSDTEDIKMVSPQPYVDPFYNKLNKEKDNAHLRTPYTASSKKYCPIIMMNIRIHISLPANGNDLVETPKINSGITDRLNTKPTIEKEEQLLNCQATFDRLNDSSMYTGIYRRLNSYDSMPASKAVSNVNKRKRLAMSPSMSKIELARERNKRWKAEDATSHDILQNRLRGAYSNSRSVRRPGVDGKGFNERSIPAIDLSLLTTKKPLLVNRSKNKMYLKNTWY